VQLTQLAPLQGTGSFYALGFTTADALGAGTGEVLIAGDGNGDVFSVDQTSGATTKLGSFGPDTTQNKCSNKSGCVWGLSGDFVFYELNGVPGGLATIRSCNPGGTGCSNASDALVQIDMGALGTAYKSNPPMAAASLTANLLGNGSGFGHLFGIGAWGDAVYAFSRQSGSGTSGTPAQLVKIDQSGNGTSLMPFPSIMNGWSGAGVTTKAAVTIPPPPVK
jgi:hypothetical protein